MFVTCFISQWMKRSKHGLFVFPPKKTPNMEKALFDHFFHRYVRLTNQSHARLHPLDKPIKSLHFRLFIVSDLFASFHFKVTRKLHYKYGNSRLKTLKTIPCSAVHTCLGQISPPPPSPPALDESITYRASCF